MKLWQIMRRGSRVVGLQQRQMYRDVVHFIDNFSYK